MFAVAYVHHHEESITRMISQVMSNTWNKGPIDVYDLSDSINVHPTVCKEVLCRMISCNVRVGAFTPSITQRNFAPSPYRGVWVHQSVRRHGIPYR